MASGFSGGTAFDGSWHSVAFRRNATAFELFVDGTRVASTTATLATGSTCNRTTLMHFYSTKRLDTLRVAFNTPRFGIERCQIARLWPYKQLGLLILRRRRLLAQRQLRQRRQRLRQQRPLPLRRLQLLPLPSRRTPTATETFTSDANAYRNCYIYSDCNSRAERYRDCDYSSESYSTPQPLRLLRRQLPPQPRQSASPRLLLQLRRLLLQRRPLHQHLQQACGLGRTSPGQSIYNGSSPPLPEWRATECTAV